MDEDVKEMQGAFFESLSRPNSQIKKDRALTIAEDAEMAYKRELEDKISLLKKLRREQNGMLDLSGDNALSLKVATDFDAKKFVEKDVELSIAIRNLEIAIELAESRYKFLFGKELS